MYEQIAAIYDLIYTRRKDYAAEAAYIHEVIQARRPGLAGSLLDVACGTGLHLAALCAWYTVTGLDAAPAMLAQARRRCPDVPLHVGDMRRFDLGCTFDVVTCLFSAVGHLPDLAALQQAVGAMARHLAPGGLLIYEPFITPDQTRDRYFSGELHSAETQAVSRMSHTRVQGRQAHIAFHHLIASADGVQYVLAQETMSLITVEEHLAACVAAGLQTEYDPVGLDQRGLYIGVKA